MNATPEGIALNGPDHGDSRPIRGDLRPRPAAHADFSAYCKYHGFEDYRGGGHFSGRITAALVAAGGVIIPVLEGIGVSLATHIAKCAGVSDRKLGDIESDIKSLNAKSFPVLDDARGEEMAQRLGVTREAAKSRLHRARALVREYLVPTDQHPTS